MTTARPSHSIGPGLAAALAVALAACSTAGPTASPAGSAAVAAASPSGGATARPASAPAASGASAPRGTAPAGATPPRAPGSPAPFAEVVKDAKSTTGWFTVWTKDEKTWIEVPAERLDQPFFLGSSLARGLGEYFFVPGMMPRDGSIVALRRAGNSLQLVARNLHVRAPEGSPLAEAVADSYSDSLLAAVPLAAAPHPERKSLLIDATALLGGDLFGVQTYLERSFRLGYSLDRANTVIERVRNDPGFTAITVRAHFAVPKLPAGPSTGHGGPPPNPATLPNPPRTLPDPRSMFLSFAYTLAPLPAQPMQARVADQRVGFFTDAYVDYASDTGQNRRRHVVNRWRLEKKDPAAAVSEPKEPIRVVMDRNIPERWREPVRAGILEWNKAFEAAGWKNAIAVEQQPAGADGSTLEGTRILAVRWFAMEGPGAMAVGPSQSDPRSGEILRGAAIIPENWARFSRALAADIEPRLNASAPFEFAARYAQCSYAFDALEQAAFGLELLALREGFDPQGPDAERFIAESLKDVVMHEVGHALGLRHNFIASTGVTAVQLRDPAFTRSRGISNSVMDYNGLNLALEGEAVADAHMATLGAYDYWAIEYGYRDFPAQTEARELAALAGRAASEPALAYATDEDVGGIDPRVNQHDLGEDPLAHARRQITLVRELWRRTQARALPADDDYTVYRRNLQRGLVYLSATVPQMARYVGGSTTSRQLAGAGQPLVAPVPAARQREALELLLGEVFSSASFRFDPGFVSRLGVEQLERGDPRRSPVDFSLPAAVLAVQRGALDPLMSDTLAARLADAEARVAEPRALLGYAEVQSRLSDAVWSELKAGREIDSLRRNLQREHLRRLAGALVRPSSPVAADVRAVHRQVALRLVADLKRAQSRSGWTEVALAHLAEAAATLDEALRAPLIKQGV